MLERELTLGDIFSLLLKRWRQLTMVFVITLVSVFVALFFLVADKYKGEATLLVMSSKLRSKQMAQDYLGLTVESYVNMVANKQLMANLLAELLEYRRTHPDSPLPKKLSQRNFSKRIQVGAVRNSQCLRICVFLEEPELACDFANRLAEEAARANFELLGKDSKDSAEYVQTRVQDSSDEYQLATMDILDLKKKLRLELSLQELNIAYGQQEAWKVQKVETEMSIIETEGRLKALIREMSVHPERKTLKRMVTESPEFVEILRSVRKPSEGADSLLQLGMGVEILNPVYSAAEAGISEASVALVAKRVKLAEIELRLAEVDTRINRLLDEKHAKETLLQEHELRMSLAQSRFQKYKTLQADIDAVMTSERQDIRIIDKAIVPDKPAGPKRPLLSGMAAILVVSIAFFAFLGRDVYHMI